MHGLTLKCATLILQQEDTFCIMYPIMGWTLHDGLHKYIPLLCPLSVGWQVRARGRFCGQWSQTRANWVTWEWNQFLGALEISTSLPRTTGCPVVAKWVAAGCLLKLPQPTFWLLICAADAGFPLSLSLWRTGVPKLNDSFCCAAWNSEKKENSAKHHLLIEWKNEWMIEFRQNLRRNEVV